MFSFIKKFWKSLFFAAVIFLLSVINFSRVKNVPKIAYSDKVIHFFLYAVWAFLIVSEFKKSAAKNNFCLGCLIIPIIYGGLIELVQQAYFPPRTAEWLDWLADILGVFLGYAISLLLSKKSSNE